MDTKKFFAERYAQTLLKKDQAEVRQLTGPGKEIFAEVRMMAEGIKAKSVLDYGCGVGKIMGSLIAMTGATKYVGVDVVASVIKANKEFFAAYKEATFRTVRGEIKGRYDLIWTSAVLQHMDDAAVEEIMANFANILTEKGTLIVWVNTTTTMPDLSYMKRRSRETYIGMIEDAFGKVPIMSKAFPVGDEEITVMIVKNKDIEE